MPTLESVLADAMTLTQRERELLVVKLHYAMEPEPWDEVAFYAELDRRMRSVENGEADLLDWDEAEGQIFGDLLG